MNIRFYRASTPGTRNRSVSSFEECTRKKPEKSLTFYIPQKSGRNNSGQITSRHRGGGHKKLYRQFLIYDLLNLTDLFLQKYL